MKKILVVDDYPEMAQLIENLLGDRYQVLVASNAGEALDRLSKHSPDLVILDVGLPDKSGFDLCDEIKNNINHSTIPIIFLSAVHGHDAHVKGYTLGGDHYIDKPFNPDELVAVVDAVFRRSSMMPTIVIGDITLDLVKQKVTDNDGKIIKLAKKEFEILSFMAQNRGQILSRESIVSYVWMDDIDRIADRTVDTYVNSLRKKIRPCKIRINSIYSEGYKLIAS